MGEIAEMMLEGLLDEQTGEYIGEENLDVYGTEAPGFPVSYEGKESPSERAKKDVLSRHKLAAQSAEPPFEMETVQLPKGTKVVCSVCGRRVKAIGYWQHFQDVHDFDIPW